MAFTTAVGRIARATAVACLCLVAAATAPAANLIVNGSFESGNTGFSSGSTFTPIPPGGVASGSTDVDAGQHRIVQNLVQAHDAWAGGGTLIAESGTNYRVANGSSSTAASPWIQTIRPAFLAKRDSAGGERRCFG